MSTFALKLLAIIAMLIDHIGAIFISPVEQPELYVAMRGIGRIAFPIFVFLIVEGFYHTRDFKKYMIRLGVFALISEIPYDLAFYQNHNFTRFIDDYNAVFSNGFDVKLLGNLLTRLTDHQNVFFTLFLGLAMIYLMHLVEIKYQNQLLISNLLDAGIVIVFCAIAYILKTDYDIAGILLFAAFYQYRGNKIMMSFCLFLISTIMSRIDLYLQSGNIVYVISMLATFAMIPISFYNGKKGKDVKYLFYIFYPAHLLLLFIISQFI